MGDHESDPVLHMSAVLQNLIEQPYRHGFVTEIESETVPKGLSE